MSTETEQEGNKKLLSEHRRSLVYKDFFKHVISEHPMHWLLSLTKASHVSLVKFEESKEVQSYHVPERGKYGNTWCNSTKDDIGNPVPISYY